MNEREQIPKQPFKVANPRGTWIPWTTNVLLVLFTAGIFWATWSYTTIAEGQLSVMIEQLREIKSGAEDTRQLAEAAKNEAEATRELADRALAQANATNALALEAKRSADIAKQALQANIESGRQDRRPWVGLQALQCNGCTVGNDGSLKVDKLFGIVANTGKTPAVQMQIRVVITGRIKSDPIPVFDAIERESESRLREIQEGLPPEMAARIRKSMELTMRDLLPAKEVLAPNATRGLPLVQSMRWGREKFTNIEDRKLIYVLGKITYYDTRRDMEHTTRFCLVNEFGADFRFCATGNDMN